MSLLVMSRLRSSAPALVARIANWLGVDRQLNETDADDALTVRKGEIVQALKAREAAGTVTTLRQLHTVTGLNQPEALSLANHLERDGVVRIDRNLGDAFESLIVLTDATKGIHAG